MSKIGYAIDMSEMICPACHRSQPPSESCAFCHTRLRIAPLSAMPLTSPLQTQGYVPEPVAASPEAIPLLSALGLFVAQEIYFEDGITLGRLGLGAAGFLGGAFVVSQLWVVVTPFWGWALASCGLGAWVTRKLYLKYAQPLLQNRFGEFSLDSQGISRLFNESLLLWFLLSTWTLGGLLLLNLGTAWFAQTHQVALQQAWIHSGKSRSYYAELAPWPGHTQPVRISLSRQEFESLGQSKEVRISTRRGILGIELRGTLIPVPPASPATPSN